MLQGICQKSSQIQASTEFPLLNWEGVDYLIGETNISSPFFCKDILCIAVDGSQELGGRKEELNMELMGEEQRSTENAKREKGCLRLNLPPPPLELP